MAETLSPTQFPPQPGQPKQRRVSISTRLQSPTSPFFLGSNDDNLERAQARAARAAAVRRKALDSLFDENDVSSGSPSVSCLDGGQILELFRNCIKLASENKINQKNTWELKLIDHLSEIIKVEAEEDTETNFQKASCTLEAGVKIYALRVDSVHSEAYKVLGGISRAGLDEHQENSVEGDNGSNEHDANKPKKDQERKLSPLSTLESSFDVLNVKKFDVAFAVDPLYHQTTAQFDEGGAKGLLLSNLGVFGGCRVLFDSQEVPAKCVSSTTDNNASNLIDISCTGECIEQMVMNAKTKTDICPAFRAIVEQLDDNSLQLRKAHSGDTCDDNTTDGSTIEFNEPPEYTGMYDAADDNGVELDDASYDHAESWSVDPNEETNLGDDSFNIRDQDLENHFEDQDPFMSSDPNIDDRFENVASLLFGGAGITSGQNAWAGPEHWKYRKSKGSETVTAHDKEPASTAKRTRATKASEADLDFTKSLDEDIPDIFAPPKNPKTLLLPSKKVPCSNKLPEDCHYQPEDLCLGKKGRRKADSSSRQHGDDFGGSYPAWDNESAHSGNDNDGYAQSDIDEMDLVSQPRQVNKIEVQYDRAAKQVDVHVLKETLWDHIHVTVRNPEMVDDDAISFKHLLSTFPDDCKAAAPQDISPHLCFICLLHLANEHGLRIQGSANLDDLSVHLPVSCQDTGAGCT